MLIPFADNMKTTPHYSYVSGHQCTHTQGTYCPLVCIIPQAREIIWNTIVSRSRSPRPSCSCGGWDRLWVVWCTIDSILRATINEPISKAGFVYNNFVWNSLYICKPNQGQSIRRCVQSLPPAVSFHTSRTHLRLQYSLAWAPGDSFARKWAFV